MTTQTTVANTITYKKWEIVTSSSLKTKVLQVTVNRINKSDDGYAQDNCWFSMSASANSVETLTWKIECFYETYGNYV